MDLSTLYIPTAGDVGILPMLTYFFLTVAAYGFLGNIVFSLATHSSIVPEHRLTRVMGAIIAAVAGVSYFLITYMYHHLLEDLAKQTDPAARQELIRDGYNAIGQFRYMDWAITTPLLLIKMQQMLRIKPSEIKGSLATLLLADFFMVVTGYIGEQQLTPTGEIDAGAKLLWGAISTVGYVFIPIILYRYYKRFGARANEIERRAYRLMAYTTVTFWGVYPIGYILTIFAVDLNYIHIAFTLADMINKIGVATVVYLAGKTLLDERIAEEKIMPGYQIS